MLQSPLAACSCGPKDPPIEALDRADVVFIGTATSVDSRIINELQALAWFGLAKAIHLVGGPDPNDIEKLDELRDIRVRFRISTQFKGELGSVATVRTSMSSAGCVYSFSRGQEYLVYAYESSGKLHTSICTRTKLTAGAFEEVEVLRDREEPLDAAVQQP